LKALGDGAVRDFRIVDGIEKVQLPDLAETRIQIIRVTGPGDKVPHATLEVLWLAILRFEVEELGNALYRFALRQRRDFPL
jgi:hypothetical protein